MENAIAAYIQPLLLAMICAITGFSAWQMKKWMERIENDHKIFYSRLNSLEQQAVTTSDDRQRKDATLERLFKAAESADREIRNIREDCHKHGERLSVLEKRVDYMERERME